LAKYKIYKVAKELNLAHTTITEFLNHMGHETPKGHMSSINDELYTAVLQKFDRARWQAMQEQEKEEQIIEQQKESERAREEELEKIIADRSEIAIDAGEEEAEAEVEPEIAEEPEVSALEEKAEVEEVEEKLEEAAAEGEAAEISTEATPQEAEAKEDISAKEETFVVEKAVLALPVTETPAEAKPSRKKKPKKEAEKAGKKEKAARGKFVPGTVEAMMADAKQDDTVVRARELARARDAAEAGVTPEDLEPATGKKRRKRRKEESAEEIAVRKAVERAQKAAKDRKHGKKAVPAATPVPQPTGAPKKRKRRRSKKQKVDQKVVEAQIKQTLASMEEKKPKKRRPKVQDTGVVMADENVMKVMEYIATNELASLLDVPVTELIKKCLEMGLVVTINQRLDKDTIELLVGEYDYEVEFMSEFEGTAEAVEEEMEEEDKEEDLKPRPPVVTVMGHVDHGKTSLLDHIREANVTAGESGGITQHIGAYSVNYNDNAITFLDTPGHEAFTAMRARGAQGADLVVLVVAADDHVMPQTLEAINHAKAAGVPIVIAINKIDKANVDTERVRRELSEHDILVEDWGGKYQCAEISAKKGTGIENLLEEIVLAAEVLDLKANPKRKSRGTIIESRLDKGRGPLATILVHNGTIKIGDNFVAGAFAGRVKAMFDERGKKLKKVEPGYPVLVLGFDGTPQAGESFIGTESEKDAKAISLKRQALQREQAFRQIRAFSLERLSEQIKAGEARELPLIIKGDVNGSVEALSDSLMKLNSEEVGVNIIHRGVGAITETDVNLAAASAALIIGFMVHPNLKAKELASKEDVEVRVYRIIYDVINDITAALEGMLAPEVSENNVGTLEVRQTFKVSRVGTIAGCYVQSGKIERNSKVRLIREGQEVYEGEISTLKRFKDDAKEVAEGFECGLSIANFNDIKEGDVIEVYELVETKRTLA
jgi:translation initiation factor IF-2